jgi:MFS family permease
MQTTAQMWLVYRLSHSSFMLGLTGFMSQAPMLLLGLLGGVVADRKPRKGILLLTQSLSALQALVLAALAFAGVIEVWHVLVLAAVLGTINAFDMPARQSFLSETVDRSAIGNAVALNSFSVNASRMVGPALAGVLLSVWGEGVCFLLNALSFLAVIYSLVLIRPPARPKRPAGSRHPFALVREGLAYAASRSEISRPLLATALLSVVGMPYAVLMPVFAREVLHGGPRSLGLLMGAVGLGAVFGALALARRESVRGMFSTVGKAMAGFGVCLFLFSLSRNFALSLGILAFAGFAMITTLAGTNTLLQSLTSEAMLGRVMSLRGVMFIGLTPLGNLAAGAGAQRFGAPAAVTVGGAVCAVAGLYLLLSARPVKPANPRGSGGIGPEEA